MSVDLRPGVSVAICCHNSAARLPETLRALASQARADDIDWEVLVIDNASTDTTADTARSAWPAHARATLRVVHEPALGLSHARERARLEARYAYVSFIDDDNWVAPDWVATVKALLDEHPEVGLCGGENIAVCETDPPGWFDAAGHFFAVGRQAPRRGPMPGFYLWGAGMSLRKSAWDALRAGGFTHQLLDRTGGALTAGGDSELCVALRLAGWQQWYEPSLQLRHYIPRGRLQWSYLRRVVRGAGISSILLIPYDFALEPEPTTAVGRFRQSWWWVAQSAIRELARDGAAALPWRRAVEGAPGASTAEYHVGRVIGALRYRRRYGRVRAALRGAPWRRPATARPTPAT